MMIFLMYMLLRKCESLEEEAVSTFLRSHCKKTVALVFDFLLLGVN